MNHRLTGDWRQQGHGSQKKLGGRSRTSTTWQETGLLASRTPTNWKRLVTTWSGRLGCKQYSEESDCGIMSFALTNHCLQWTSPTHQMLQQWQQHRTNNSRTKAWKCWSWVAHLVQNIAYACDIQQFFLGVFFLGIIYEYFILTYYWNPSLLIGWYVIHNLLEIEYPKPYVYLKKWRILKVGLEIIETFFKISIHKNKAMKLLSVYIYWWVVV